VLTLDGFTVVNLALLSAIYVQNTAVIFAAGYEDHTASCRYYYSPPPVGTSYVGGCYSDANFESYG